VGGSTLLTFEGSSLFAAILVAQSPTNHMDVPQVTKQIATTGADHPIFWQILHFILMAMQMKDKIKMVHGHLLVNMVKMNVMVTWLKHVI